jgi:hypothetical protein
LLSCQLQRELLKIELLNDQFELQTGKDIEQMLLMLPEPGAMLVQTFGAGSLQSSDLFLLCREGHSRFRRSRCWLWLSQWTTSPGKYRWGTAKRQTRCWRAQSPRQLADSLRQTVGRDHRRIRNTRPNGFENRACLLFQSRFVVRNQVPMPRCRKDMGNSAVGNLSPALPVKFLVCHGSTARKEKEIGEVEAHLAH